MIESARTLELTAIKGSKLSCTVEIPEALNILDNPKDTPEEGFGIFRVMTPKDGDKRIVWDRRSFDEIRQAKDLFDKLITQGLKPFKVGVNGQASSELMTEFDPGAEEVIFMPQALVAGG